MKKTSPPPPPPSTSETVLEDPFEKLWADVASEVMPDKHLPLVRQVSLSDIIAFSEGTVTGQNLDFVCHPLRLSIEIQGATSKGRNGAHSSFQGLRRDYYKQWMMTMSGWKHLELDGDMSRDRELIKATIIHATRDSYILPNPTGFESWGRNKTNANKLKRETRKLLTYLKGKTTAPRTKILANLLKIRVTSIRPIMEGAGWKQKTVNKKLMWTKN